MEYTIKKLARLAGISTRTLRYYDEIGLLVPARINTSGYRIYGSKEVDALQQILLFKEMGFELDAIKKIMSDASFDRLEAMKQHLEKLEEQENRIKLLINNVKQTILEEQGGIKMSDIEKFEGLKKELVDKNEEKYGKEIRERYGDDTVDESNRKMMNLSKEDYDKMQKLAEDINARLEKAVLEKEEPTSEVGKEIAMLHKEWLTYAWSKYSSEAHRGLGEMYVADQRFTANYDKNVEGCAEFLRNAINEHIV